jgi:hypothetical protein
MGQEWRKDFYPEEHMEMGYSPLHKVLNLRVKETRLQRHSTIPGGNVLPLTYVQRLIIICRRLAKTGECNAGRPDRTVFEELKERFWYKSIESKANSPKEKAIRYQRLWFFYHVYETMEALRSRTKKCNWRPWLDEEIDLCQSSEDEDQVVEAPKIEIIKDPEEEGLSIDVTNMNIPQHPDREPYISYNLKNHDGSTTRIVGSKERKEKEEREAKERKEKKEAEKAESDEKERERNKEIEAINQKSQIETEKKIKEEEERRVMMKRLEELEKEKATRERIEKTEKEKAERLQREQLELAQREEEALRFRGLLTQKSIEQKYKENLVMDKFLATSLFPNRSFTPPGNELIMSALGNTMQGFQEDDTHFPDLSPDPNTENDYLSSPTRRAVSAQTSICRVLRGLRVMRAYRMPMVEDSTIQRLNSQ